MVQYGEGNDHKNTTTTTTTSAHSIINQKEDGNLVGSDAIFSSPNVTEPKSDVNHTIPTPSIFTDVRGSIHNILVGDKRINILYTKAGVMRSGDIHRNAQHDFIFSGKVEVWTLSEDGSTEKKIYHPHDLIKIPPHVPHVFHFLEKTIMAEWWEPGSFRAWFYKPYRKIVDQSFEALGKDGVEPRMIVYKEADGENNQCDQRPYHGETRFNLLSMAAVGAIGFSIGLLVGRRSR